MGEQSILLEREKVPDIVALKDGDYQLGVRPHHLSLVSSETHSVEIKARVSVTEITGSESFIHFDFNGQRWIALVHGINPVNAHEVIRLYLDPRKFYFFSAVGNLVRAPTVPEN